MGKMKHVVAIIIVLTVLIGGFVYLLPKLSEMQLLDRSKKNENSAVDTASVRDTLPDTLSFEEKMKISLAPLDVSYSKRKKRQIWTMGGGETIITYLLYAKRFTERNGGKILYMEEIYNLDPSIFQAAKVDILSDKDDTLKLELQVSRNEFKPGASLLAVGFQVTTITPELIVAANKLDYPYDLLIPPFGLNDDAYEDLNKFKHAEITLWITMESSKLNRVHNTLRPLRIHHTAEQIETVINDAHNKIPEARGVVSRYGEQAVEHRQLLQAILSPIKQRNLWFMDISMNKLSIVPQTCKDLGLTCKNGSPYNPENSSLDDYIKAKMREAKRSGLAVMILPLTNDAIEKLSDLSEKAKRQGTTLINLSTFMKK